MSAYSMLDLLGVESPLQRESVSPPMSAVARGVLWYFIIKL